jgi:hypothetical protein
MCPCVNLTSRSLPIPLLPRANRKISEPVPQNPYIRFGKREYVDKTEKQRAWKDGNKQLSTQQTECQYYCSCPVILNKL